LVSARFPQGDFKETVNVWARKRRFEPIVFGRLQTDHLLPKSIGNIFAFT